MEFQIGNKKITVYEGKNSDIAVFMNSDHAEGAEVFNECENCDKPFTLIAIDGIDWNGDLSPWMADAIFPKGEPFTGGADAYLAELTMEIIPQIEEKLKKTFSKKILAGYSLAGLFALYSVYNTDAFQGVVSASGSLWYPQFLEYTKQHTISTEVQCVYFSLGDKEANTKNPIMQLVDIRTQEIYQDMSKQCKTIFEYNAGGHFVDDTKRLAKGICWTVQQL